MKIGIIGGSFDPFHLGHKRIINETISKLNLDKMLIMPTKHNPWKDDCVANDKQRIAMIHLTMEGNKQYEISRIELDNPTNEKNYTIDTIKINPLDQKVTFYNSPTMGFVKIFDNLENLITYMNNGYI